jgi:hypothetical protein
MGAVKVQKFSFHVSRAPQSREMFAEANMESVFDGELVEPVYNAAGQGQGKGVSQGCRWKPESAPGSV